jgi:hypothetical protein
VILTTAIKALKDNTAKGLEYDNVQVLDDFIELNVGENDTKNT